MSPTISKKDHRVVLVGGCFDVLHIGHITFLQQAKTHGNYLLIALESDENVRRRKGAQRPIHTQNQRQHMLESLHFVDEVLPLPTMTNDTDYSTLVTSIKPYIIAVTEGDTYLSQKQKQAQAVNASVVVIPKVPTLSTSQLAKLIGLE